MGTGQVSIWVPIAVGIIGLIGVILGQFINAWRERRHWRRETAYEERRWKREERHTKNRDKYQDLWDQKNRNLDRQFEACAGMVTALHRWHGLLLRLDRAHQNEAPNLEPLINELTQLETTVDECIGKIELLCAEPVARAAISAWAAYGQRVDLFADPAIYKSLADAQIEAIWDSLRAENEKFLTVARNLFKPKIRTSFV